MKRLPVTILLDLGWGAHTFHWKDSYSVPSAWVQACPNTIAHTHPCVLNRSLCDNSTKCSGAMPYDLHRHAGYCEVAQGSRVRQMPLHGWVLRGVSRRHQFEEND